MLCAVRRAPGSLARGLSRKPRATAFAKGPSPRSIVPVHHKSPLAFTARSLHSSPSWLRGAFAEARANPVTPEEEFQPPKGPSGRKTAPENQQGRITTFQELADQDLVDEKLILPITRDMNITTMTDVQSLTINETLTGVDV